MTTQTAIRPTTDEARWQAVLDRHLDIEAPFFYGVRSTGVYCRPSCPSRQPNRGQVTFFDHAAAAVEAGFRPCKRCRPDEPPVSERIVARVRDRLDEAAEMLDLETLAAEAGISASHLRRVFQRETGLTPRQYATQRRFERLKAGLKQGQTVTAAMYEAGFGSSRALYESASKQLGMKPSVYRNGGRGETVAYGSFETSLGRLLIAASRYGVCAVRFDDDATAAAELRAEFPNATLVEDEDVVNPFLAAIDAGLKGQNVSAVPLDTGGSEFQQIVWTALAAIPSGATRTYSEVAETIGRPGAARAVARACATNRLALLIPCHRVIGANGSLTGYRWGIERKRALLEQERTGSPR